MHTERSPAQNLNAQIVALSEGGASINEIAIHLGVSPLVVEQGIGHLRPVPVNIAFDHPAYMPRYGSEQAAGIDLCAKEGGLLGYGRRALVRTGLSMALPPGTFGMIAPRSGLALKHGVTVLNAPGIVDSDYRGDIGVILHNTDTMPFEWKEGDRIAQMIVMRHLRVDMWEVTRLDETDRGAGGFGSTGVPS